MSIKHKILNDLTAPLLIRKLQTQVISKYLESFTSIDEFRGLIEELLHSHIPADCFSNGELDFLRNQPALFQASRYNLESEFESPGA